MVPPFFPADKGGLEAATVIALRCNGRPRKRPTCVYTPFNRELFGSNFICGALPPYTNRKLSL